MGVSWRPFCADLAGILAGTTSRPVPPLSGRFREPRSREAHVPTQQPQEEEDPRLPYPDADAGRQADPGPSSQQGPSRVVGLTIFGYRKRIWWGSILS